MSAGSWNPLGKTHMSLPATTGLSQFRGVIVNASGKAAYPAASGDPIVGVVSGGGTTGSTKSSWAVDVYTVGMVATCEAAGSTLAAGAAVQFDTSGRATALTAGGYRAGVILYGSSGSTDRRVSVLLDMYGTT